MSINIHHPNRNTSESKRESNYTQVTGMYYHQIHTDVGGAVCPLTVLSFLEYYIVAESLWANFSLATYLESQTYLVL